MSHFTLTVEISAAVHGENTLFKAFLLQFTSILLFSCDFQDPSVTQVRQAAPPGLEEYNPFADAKSVSTFTMNPVIQWI